MKLGIGCLIIASLTACTSQPVQPAIPQLPPPPTTLQTMMSTCDLSVASNMQSITSDVWERITPAQWDAYEQRNEYAIKMAAYAGQDPNQLRAKYRADSDAYVQGRFLKYLAKANAAMLSGDMDGGEKAMRPDLQALNGKFPLGLNQIQQPGLSLLSTERGPTPDEQAALAIYDQLHRSCVEAQVNWLLDATHGTMPDATVLQQKMFAAEQNHLTALYQGRETFAQFTRAVSALHVGFMNDASQMAQSAYDKTQQQIRSSAPIQTNCQSYTDGSVRCTTQQ